jgi:hypothetical protein
VDGEWKEWLQRNRSELNSMTTPQFLEWLDHKIALYDVGKVMPPIKVMAERLESEMEQRLRREITDSILREAGIDRQVHAAVRELRPLVKATAAGLRKAVVAGLKLEPTSSWVNVVERSAADVAASRGARSARRAKKNGRSR